MLLSSSAYAYTCNGNQCTIGTESGVTLSNTSSPSVPNNAEVEIQQGANVTAGYREGYAVGVRDIMLQIVANRGLIQGDKGGGIHNVSGEINQVTNQNGAIIQGGRAVRNYSNATIGTVTNLGIINGNVSGIHNDNGGTINAITNESGATIQSTQVGIQNTANATITNLTNSGTISGNTQGINNQGTITTLNNNTGANINSIDNTRTITTLNNQGRIERVTNSGANASIDNFTNDANGQIETVSNQGAIDTFTNNGQIQNVDSTNGTINIITNSGTITNLNANSINNGITNSGRMDTLSVTTINGGVTNSGNINTLTANTINGTLTNQGTIRNLNNNNGTIDTISNSGTISSLSNSGTITDTLTNSGTITHLNNTGTLAGGITNSGNGRITLNSAGNIGLNANGLHIENTNNTAKAITIENISPMRFNKPKVSAGVTSGIFIKQITAQVEREGLMLEDLIEEEGINVANNCENCILGLDENGQESNYSVFVKNTSVLLNDFYAKRGQATNLTLDTSALSGSTISQSIITNSRLRNIRTNSILKEFSIKNFQTKFGNDIEKLIDSEDSNSKESNLESLESYNLNESEKYASLTQDMILSENAESTAQTWSDEDLIQELDDIFIANKSGGEYYTFIAPYFSYDSSDIGGGDIKGHTRGFLAGIQTPLDNNAGIVGAFFGYERTDKGLSSASFNGDLDFNDTSFLMGVSYYNVFYRKGLVEYYLSGNAKLDRSESKINRGYEGGEAKAKPKSIGYGIESKVGANIYNIYDNSVLSPEIGLVYQGVSMENYTLDYGNIQEHYFTEDTNFVDMIAALRWQRAANPMVKYNVSLGAYWNLYEGGKVRGIAAGFPLNEEVRTSDYFAFTNIGITYAILKNAELSFNYNGILGDKTQSHTGYMRLGIWW